LRVWSGFGETSWERISTAAVKAASGTGATKMGTEKSCRVAVRFE
jgi:hypothetical protein